MGVFAALPHWKELGRVLPGPAAAQSTVEDSRSGLVFLDGLMLSVRENIYFFENIIFICQKHVMNA